MLQIEPQDKLTAPLVLERSVLSISSPLVKLPPGTLVRVSGWVRIPKPITASVDGALFYDTAGGEPLAIRLTDPTPWKKLTLYRKVPASGQIGVTLANTGLGTVLRDDVRHRTADGDRADTDHADDRDVADPCRLDDPDGSADAGVGAALKPLLASRAMPTALRGHASDLDLPLDVIELFRSVPIYRIHGNLPAEGIPMSIASLASHRGVADRANKHLLSRAFFGAKYSGRSTANRVLLSFGSEF